MRISDWRSDVCSSDLARRIGNIQPNEERIATSSPDFGYDALGHLFIEVADYDLGAFFRETLRLSGAEPARSTRDERNLACESVSQSSSSENAQLRELPSRSAEHTTELQSLMRIPYAV